MKLLAMSMCLAVFHAASQIPQQYKPTLPDSKKVVARMNGKDITVGEVLPYLWEWRANEALEDLLNYRLIKEEADKQLVSVTQEEVEKELKAQLDRVKSSIPPGDDLDTYIKEQGFPRSRLYLRLTAELLLDKIVLKSFDADKFVEVSTIIIRPRSEAATDLAEAIKQAQAAYDDLKKGQTWEIVLKKYGNEPNAVSANGRLGWRMISVFPAPVKEDLLLIKTGEFTRPAQTQNGIQIFRLDRRGREAKGEDLEALRNQFRAEARQSILDQLRKNTKIERLLNAPAGG